MADDLQDSLGAAVMRGRSWVLLAQAIGTGVRVVSSIILARLVMPADFGVYAMVAAVLGGLLIFKDLALCDAIIQWPGLTPKGVIGDKHSCSNQLRATGYRRPHREAAGPGVVKVMKGSVCLVGERRVENCKHKKRKEKTTMTYPEVWAESL